MKHKSRMRSWLRLALYQLVFVVGICWNWCMMSFLILFLLIFVSLQKLQ